MIAAVTDLEGKITGACRSDAAQFMRRGTATVTRRIADLDCSGPSGAGYFDIAPSCT